MVRNLQYIGPAGGSWIATGGRAAGEATESKEVSRVQLRLIGTEEERGRSWTAGRRRQLRKRRLRE